MLTKSLLVKKRKSQFFFIRRHKEKAYGYVGKAYGDPYVKTKQKQNKVTDWPPEVQRISTFGGMLPILFSSEEQNFLYILNK